MTVHIGIVGNLWRRDSTRILIYHDDAVRIVVEISGYTLIRFRDESSLRTVCEAKQKRTRWRFFACLVLLISMRSASFAAAPEDRISQYGHTVWRIQDGYFGGTVGSVAQTADGYIWVGTDAGLFKFDGVRFVRWVSPSGEQLPPGRVLALLGARDGSLWIGTDGGLAHLVNKRLVQYQKNEGWEISYILADREGKIWISHSRPDDEAHPLCQVAESEVRCYGREDGLDVLGVGPLAQDVSGDLWIGGSTTLGRWRDGAPKVYRPQALRGNDNIDGVTALLAAKDGSLWVGIGMAARGAGLQRMIDGALKPFVAPKLNGESLEVSALAADRQGGVWVGTTHGIYRIQGMDVDHYGSAEGLSSDFVNNIFEDREGDIWVATAQGLDMFRHLRVKTISQREGLNDDAADSVVAIRDGTVWIGTSRWQVLEPNGVSFGAAKALPGNQTTSLLEDHTGRLWAGMNNRLFVQETGNFREITKPDGSALGMVKGITEDSAGNTWVSTLGRQRALIRIQDLQVRQELRVPEIPLANKIVADRVDGIWLGLMTGDLARYRDGQVKTFRFGDHPNSQVLAITAASDGSIFGATAFGVLGFKNGKQGILTVQNGLPCNSVMALISDEAANLWLYAECGLIEIPNEQIKLWWEQPDRELSPRVFDTYDGVRPGLGHFNTSTKTQDGRLWFANGNVVQVIDPPHVSGNPVAPNLDITTFVADRKEYRPESPIRLPPRTGDLEIDYAALSYVAPQKVRFRYILEGHDTKWVEPGTRRQAFYNDLPPGRYRFRVLACNSDGVWNTEGASISFSVLPAYYQTTWFRALYIGAFLGLLWALYHLRVRQMQRKFAMVVEVRVNERTRIARDLHDTVLQSLHGLLLSFQRASNLLPHRPVEAKQRLEGAIDQAAQAITEGREAVQGLRSSTVITKDLAVAIQTLGDELAAQESRQEVPLFDVVVEGTPRDLYPILRDDVYRIAGEALRNAFHHAQARRIEVEIQYKKDHLRLRVRDDGKGVDSEVFSEGRSGHWGLQGMRERAKLLGGQLEVWSELDSGTEIQLSIPASIAYLT